MTPINILSVFFTEIDQVSWAAVFFFPYIIFYKDNLITYLVFDVKFVMKYYNKILLNLVNIFISNSHLNVVGISTFLMVSFLKAKKKKKCSLFNG